MIAKMYISNLATIETMPASELSEAAVELIVYVEGGDNLTLVMNKKKGMEIVSLLAKQLDKVEEVAQHRKESQQKMLDSIQRLGGN